MKIRVMRELKHKVFFLFILSLILNCWGIKNNLPSQERSALVLKSAEELAAFTPVLLETRKTVYKSYELHKDIAPVLRAYTPGYKEIEVTMGNEKIFVPERFIHQIRGILVQSFGVDEQQLIWALQEINRHPFFPNPRFFYYGGAYIYSAGAFLKLCSLFKIVRVTSDLSHYFRNPGEMQKLYVILRFWGALFASLAVFLIYFICMELYGNEKISLLCGAFYTLSPLIVVQSQALKPYAFSVFWMLLSLFLMVLTVRRMERKYFFLASFVLGISAGAIYFSAFLLFPLLVAYYFGIFKKNGFRGFFCGMGLIILGFLITNPFWFLSLDIVAKELAHVWGCAGFGVSFRKIFIYVFKTMPAAFSWPVFLLVFGGTVAGFIKREKKDVLILSSFIPLFLYCSFSRYQPAHAYYGIFLVPMGVLLAGNLLEYLGERKAILGKCLVVISILTALSNSLYYVVLSVKEDIRISSGRWINENIPQYSKIGIGGDYEHSYPIFQFWKYRVKTVPPESDFKDVQYYIRLERDNITDGDMSKGQFECIGKYELEIPFLDFFFSNHLMHDPGKKIIIYGRMSA